MSYNADKSAHYLNYNALKKQVRLAQKPLRSEAPNDPQSLNGMACTILSNSHSPFFRARQKC
jgi:hypothetical protein